MSKMVFFHVHFYNAHVIKYEIVLFFKDTDYIAQTHTKNDGR